MLASCASCGTVVVVVEPTPRARRPAVMGLGVRAGVVAGVAVIWVGTGAIDPKGFADGSRGGSPFDCIGCDIRRGVEEVEVEMTPVDDAVASSTG